MTSKHVVLLGDSIFDNAAYVPDGPSVVNHLQSLIPLEWKATLLAIDGDVTADVTVQIPRIPGGATHLFISVGGNDALAAMDTFTRTAGTVREALCILTEVRQKFQRGYCAMLWEALGSNLPVVVCTIYDAVPRLSAEAQTALSIFNDTITNEAAAAGISVIDLRHVCTEPGDFSTLSPIEPSEQGGFKIAQVIAGMLA